MRKTRKMYKGSHWVSRGGFHFIFKTRHHEPIFRGRLSDKITDSLMPLKEKHGAVDFAVRVFPYHIHIFLGPMRRTSPQAFGDEVLAILEEIIHNHYGTRDVFDRDFYFATVSDVSAEAVEKELEGLRLI